MIRSFSDKQREKAKIYEAKQKVLAEQAEQDRIRKEEERWNKEYHFESHGFDRWIMTESEREYQFCLLSFLPTMWLYPPTLFQGLNPHLLPSIIII